MSLSTIENLISQGQLEQAYSTLKTVEASGKQNQNKIQLTFANILRKQHKYDEAINILSNIALSPSTRLSFQYEVTKELGINYRKSHLLDLAESTYLLALKLAKQTQDKTLIGQSYNNLGTLYDTKNNVATSMEYLLKAQTTLKDSLDWEVKASNFYNLGDLSVRVNNLEQAEFFFTKALINDKKSTQVINIADTTIRLAEVTLKNKKYPQALSQFLDVIKILKPLGANLSLSRAYNSLHLIYIELGNHHMALSSIQKSLNHSLITQSPIQKAYSYLHIIKFHLKLKNIALSEIYIAKVEPLVMTMNNHIFEAKLHLYKAQNAHLKQQYKQAYSYLNKAFSIHKLADIEVNQGATEQYKQQINALVQYQKLAQTEQKSALMKVELENQILLKRSWLLACIMVFLISAIVVYLYIIKHRNAQYKAKLYQTNLKQKDQMLADISHELRTPLSVLKLHVEALEHNLLDNKVLAYSKINNKISQLNNLISDVYQLSQAQNQALQLNWQQYQLSTLIAHYLSDSKALAEQHNLRFIADIEIADDTYITTDKQKLDQIITNLIKNACLYTDTPGHIRLKVRICTEHVFIQIDDTTPGVSDAQLNKLFERLYRIDKSRSRALGGSGLGLSICESLTQALQGEICLHHGKSGGLCVRMKLPITPTM